MENIKISNKSLDLSINKELVDLFIKDVEDKLQKTLNIWGYKNLSDFVKNTSDRQKTVEKTKLLSHFYEKSFKDVCKSFGYEINESSSNGYDIIINGIKYEMKLTLSQGDSWTGNSYSQVKVEDLILIKLNFNDDNKVNKIFFGVLKAKNSIWTSSKNGKNNSAFSTLDINKNDISNLNIVYGSVRVKTKFLEINQLDYNN